MPRKQRQQDKHSFQRFGKKTKFGLKNKYDYVHKSSVTSDDVHLLTNDKVEKNGKQKWQVKVSELDGYGFEFGILPFQKLEYYEDRPKGFDFYHNRLSKGDVITVEYNNGIINGWINDQQLPTMKPSTNCDHYCFGMKMYGMDNVAVSMI